MIFLITAHFKHVINDMWLGLYWTYKDDVLDIYVTLFPCYPFHVEIIIIKECSLCHKRDHDLTPWYIPAKGTIWLCDYCIGFMSGLPICIECGTRVNVRYSECYNHYFCKSCMESQAD
jgi:hypothetical protein